MPPKKQKAKPSNTAVANAAKPTKPTNPTDHTKLINKLADIDGLGVKRADVLVAKGVRTVADLKKKKFIPLLPVETKYAVLYDIDKNLPYDYVRGFVSYMPSYLIGVGSYRRQRAFLHDVDFITTTPFDKVIKDLNEMENRAIDLDRSFRIMEVYAQGDTKLSMIIFFNKRYIRVDIFKTTKKEMPFALLHYTGSKEFNIRVRKVAKEKGYKLNQRGLFKIIDGKSVELKSEADILSFLCITQRPPYNRNR